jgi:drug/metabolite transporter (DMT)-like permease
MGIINLTFSIILLLLTILGDYLLKKASSLPAFTGWKLMVLGCMIYFIAAIGWYFIYKTTKFFTLGTFYSLGHLLLTILIAILIFKEKLDTTEIVGLFFGVLSLILLFKKNHA